MKRPPTLLMLAIGSAIALGGLWMWHDQGAFIWMSGIIAYCL